MIDAQTRAANAQVILDVLAAKGGDGRFLRAIAGRESGLNHAIRHRMREDADGSLAAWRRNVRLFAGNPWYDDVTLWNHGKGLFGMMPAYHLQRWDPLAHPDILLNPYVASVAAARLTASAMRNGATTWADVDQAWATGSPRRTASWDARRDRMRARLRRIGYPQSLVDERPTPGDWGLGPQLDQNDVLWWVAGDAADDFDHGVEDENQDDVEDRYDPAPYDDEDFSDADVENERFEDDVPERRPRRRSRRPIARVDDDGDGDDRRTLKPLLAGGAALAAVGGVAWLALR
ncbi:MAG: hypothetical protein AAGA54_35310 [Myxococcota bacterium]